MPNWYEVFDNEEVQFLTRTQVTNLIRAVCYGGVLSLGFFLYTYHQPLSVVMSMLVLLAIWLNVAAWLLRRFNRLRRVMWCVKLSDRRVVGYDYARRKTTLDWTRILRVDLTSKGLVLVGVNDTSIEIPHLFPEFSTLSHRIESYARFYGVPVCVDGSPWDEVDIESLYPVIRRSEKQNGDSSFTV